jgi:tetratricopeptide (TPR) repeat protein
MKPLKLLPVLVVFVCMPAFSQNKVIDSLKNLLHNATSDTLRAHLLNDIAVEFTENDPAAMHQYAKKALDFSVSKGLKKHEAAAWVNIGNSQIMMSRYADALKSFTTAQTIYEELIATAPQKDRNYYKDGVGRVYGSIGIVCTEQNDYAKALEYYFKTLKIYEELRQDEYVAIVTNNIGIVYQAQKEYNKALEYFDKARWLQRKTGDYESMGVTLTNIGTIYLDRGEFSQALDNFKKAEKIFGSHENQRGIAELYNNMGNYYRKRNEYVDAELYYKKALAIFEGMDLKFGIASSLKSLGTLYASRNKNTEAIAYLEKAALVAREADVPEEIVECEKELSGLYEKTGKVALALEHYKKYTDARESINTSENIKAMVREEMNYEFERKAALQKAENEKKLAVYNEQAKRHQMQIVFIILLAVLIFGIAFLVYSRLQLKKRLTLQRDLAEYEQKALHLQMNPHFVFNCLGSISSFIVQNGTDSAIKYLAKFSKLMRLTLEYSKESLIPIDKEMESLQNYLELEQLRFNQAFDFSIAKSQDIEDDMALPPLLLQPFVENAIIHGIVPKKAKGSISIDFRLDKEQLVCTVTDDGIGINQSRKLKEKLVSVHKSMALEITRKRLEVIQAVTGKSAYVDIAERKDDTGVPNGTIITLYLPIQFSSDK